MKKLIILSAALLLLTGCGAEGSSAAETSKTASSKADTPVQTQATTTAPLAANTTAANSENTADESWRVALNHMMRPLDTPLAETLLQMTEAQPQLAQQPSNTYDANFYFDRMSGEGHGYYLQLTDQGWAFVRDDGIAFGVSADDLGRATRLVNEAVGDKMPQTASGDQPQITFRCENAPVGTGIVYATADQTGLPYDAVKSVSLTDSSGKSLYIDTLDGGEYLDAMADLYGAPTVVLLVDPTDMPAGDYTVTINGSSAKLTLLPEQDYINQKSNG